MDDGVTILGYVLSALTALGGWWAGRRKRKNDFLEDLQGLVNMLTEENAKLLKELVEVRKDNLVLRSNQEQMKIEIEALRKENGVLREEIGELNERLKGLKN